MWRRNDSSQRAVEQLPGANLSALLWRVVVCALLFDCQSVRAADPLDEVTVTAQKRTEGLQEVPLSVSALYPAALVEQSKLTAGTTSRRCLEFHWMKWALVKTNSRFAELPPYECN